MATSTISDKGKHVLYLNHTGESIWYEAQSGWTVNSLYSNTSNGWTILVLLGQMSSSLSANTSKTLVKIPKATVDIIGSTYITGLGGSTKRNSVCEFILNTYGLDENNKGSISMRSGAALQSGDNIAVTFAFPVTL